MILQPRQGEAIGKPGFGGCWLPDLRLTGIALSFRDWMNPLAMKSLLCAAVSGRIFVLSVDSLSPLQLLTYSEGLLCEARRFAEDALL